MGLGTRLTKLENQGSRHGMLRNEEQLSRRLGDALVALVHWAKSSGLFAPAELVALRASINDPVGSWSLTDPRLPLALGVERKIPTAHLRAVHSAWANRCDVILIRRPRMGWVRSCPFCMPSGRLALAASAALRDAHSDAERDLVMDVVDGLRGGSEGVL